MITNAAATVTVAPREVSDLVYRVSRCAGCVSGTADLIAENVRFGEMFYGGAIEVFLAAVGSDELELFITSPNAVFRAEVDRAETLTFASPVPLAAVGAALWQSASRGWGAIGIDHQTVGADALFETFCFASDVVPAGCREAMADVERVRSVEGVVVSADAFAQLYDAAKAFLVPEAVLDAAVPD